MTRRHRVWSHLRVGVSPLVISLRFNVLYGYGGIVDATYYSSMSVVHFSGGSECRLNESIGLLV